MLGFPLLAQATGPGTDETSSAPAAAGDAATDAAAAAEPGAVERMFDAMTGSFGRLDTLARPEPLIENLQTLGAIWAVVFLIAGVACMLNGYKFQKTTITAAALLLGSFAGYWVGRQLVGPDAGRETAAFIVAGLLGMLLAVLVLPMMKAAVVLFGGLAGAFLGANLWTAAAGAANTAEQVVIPEQHFWFGALMGAMLCGMLALVVSSKAVELFASVGGALLMVFGGVALLLSFEEVRAGVAGTLTAHPAIVPMLVLVPAVIAFVLQSVWEKQAIATKKKLAKASGGSGGSSGGGGAGSA